MTKFELEIEAGDFYMIKMDDLQLYDFLRL